MVQPINDLDIVKVKIFYSRYFLNLQSVKKFTSHVMSWLGQLCNKPPFRQLIRLMPQGSVDNKIGLDRLAGQRL